LLYLERESPGAPILSVRSFRKKSKTSGVAPLLRTV
jgi:hypothetical protein